MSQQLRQRSAAAAVAVFLAGTPLLDPSVAWADPVPAPTGAGDASGVEVVFTGRNLLGVSCASSPSATAVTVPAESTLRVVNDTGRRARLLIDGDTRGEIADGAAAEVLFHRGPVSLALRPNCVVADESEVRVEVAPPPRRSVERPGPERVAPVPTATPGTGDRPDGAEARAGGADAFPDVPDDGGDDDGSSPLTAAAGRSVGESDARSALPAPMPPRGVAAEPTASVEPVRQTGTVALLALVATISVIGVSAGAIRAILAQRTSRTVPA
ncbi:hypothetical protein SAMN05444365_101981 [Micromonospora pattaloongensis]|uniref:Uncharacterized protein n=1 Tax=Micromonospora pattaloongensis TaxID=405436 RepID=A0A1H3HT64_9ACTN|nr:hypothetical protein [Micromonospora pattaloongensis]SDY18721.1 hypothetical protein SAMN05444365_101981 [Micromonospora pattaloongensis]